MMPQREYINSQSKKRKKPKSLIREFGNFIIRYEDAKRSR